MSAACVSIVVMMLITSYDASARYLFNAPLIWSYEVISYYLLAFTLYLAVAATFASGDHVSLDLFRSMFPTRLRNWFDVIWCLLVALAFCLFVYAAWHDMMRAYNRGAFYPGFLRWPTWPSFLPIILGGGLTVLRVLFHAWELAVHGRDLHSNESGETSQ